MAPGRRGTYPPHLRRVAAEGTQSIYDANGVAREGLGDY